MAVRKRFDWKLARHVDEIDWEYLRDEFANHTVVHMKEERIPHAEVDKWLQGAIGQQPIFGAQACILDHDELACIVGWTFLRHINGLKAPDTLPRHSFPSEAKVGV